MLFLIWLSMFGPIRKLIGLLMFVAIVLFVWALVVS